MEGGTAEYLAERLLQESVPTERFLYTEPAQHSTEAVQQPEAESVLAACR